MTEKCTNEKTGRLLHAYEIGALNEELVEAVEIHLLECDYCLSRLKEFRAVTAMMTQDEKAREEIARLDKTVSSGTKPTLIGRLFNPELPVFLRPASLLAVILVLLATTLVSVLMRPVVEPGPIQEINLINNRAAGNDIVVGDNVKNISLAFTHLSYDSQTTCSVILERNDRDTVFYDGDFRVFDVYKTGRLLIPNSELAAGVYTLSICNTDPDSGSEKSEFVFTIRREK